MGNTSYLYHTNGSLQSEDGPWPNDTVSYGYTINRLRQSLSLKNSSGTLLWGQTNSYDAANRLTNLVSGAGAFVYQYPTDSASRRVQKLTLANTAFITNTYDALARLTVTTLKNSTNTVLNIHQYGYNQAGQRTSVTNLNTNRIDYGYNALGQLTYATGRESDNTLRSHEQLSYVYDLAGNLTQRNRNQLTTSLTVNNNNQLNTAIQSGSLTVAGRVYGSSTPISVTVNDLKKRGQPIV